jgi:hypothetical protein
MILWSLGIVVLGLLGYMFVFDPWRRRRPLKEALSILQDDRRNQFDRAEELLDQSLVAGLRRKDVATARYALAYLRTILGKYEEASTVLQDLEKSKAKIDGPVAYLMLYVNSKVQNHERVERIYREHENLLSGVKQTELIVSMSFLALARLRWARREINGAMFYFNEVRKLQVLAGEVPGHIDDHEVVVGVTSLFEKNVEEAARHFEAAIEEARKQEKDGYSGRLGLALCRWISGEVESVDAELESLLAEMSGDAETEDERPFKTECTHCSRKYKVKGSYRGKVVRCNACRRRFEIQPLDQDEDEAEESDKDAAAGESRSESRLLSDEDRIVLNARVWHCVVRLVAWGLRAERSGLPDSERRLFRSRLKKVIRIDPDLGDPYLMGGLVDYYFARTDEERQRGFDQIKTALANDVHVPEVLQLRDREEKLAALSQHSATFFMNLSKQYIQNGEVDPKYRKQLLDKMSRFHRFCELGAVDPNLEKHAAPSLENLKGRGQILSTRVSNILRARMADTSPEMRERIGEQLEAMQDRSESLSDTAKALQQAEFDLMNVTADFVFSDDEPEGASAEIPHKPTWMDRTRPAKPNDATEEIPPGEDESPNA